MVGIFASSRCVETSTWRGSRGIERVGVEGREGDPTAALQAGIGWASFGSAPKKALKSSWIIVWRVIVCLRRLLVRTSFRQLSVG